MNFHIKNRLGGLVRYKFNGAPVASIVILCAVWLFLLYCNLDFGALGVNDDVVIYRNLLQSFSFWQIPAHLYATWSSRTLIEMTIVIFSMVPVQVWAVINSFIMVIILFMLIKLVDSELSIEHTIITSLLFLTVQWEFMSTAGWIATTLNYLWTSCAGLFALFVIYKLSKGCKIAVLVQILSVVILLYSLNMEITLAFHVIVTAALAIYLVYSKTRIPPLMYVHIAAIAGALLYTSLSPGVALRFITEINGFFPDMHMRGFARNIELGLSAAMRTFLFERDMLFGLFCLIVAVAVFKLHKNIFYRLISLCPLVATLCFGVFKGLFISAIPIFAFIPQSVTQEGIITFDNANNFPSHIPFFIICAVITCIIVSLYIIFGHTEMSLLAIILFCASFATCAAVGFTPVVWASARRTSMVFILCIIALCTLIYKNIQNKRSLSIYAFYCALALSAAEGALNLLQI